MPIPAKDGEYRSITIRMPRCPYCNSIKIKLLTTHGTTRYYRCTECSERFKGIIAGGKKIPVHTKL